MGQAVENPKLSESKSVHVTISNGKVDISINGLQMPYANTVKYMVMALDTKLNEKV